MSIWNKLFTAVRGSATEAGEAIVDNQAIRILDQEMRDARKSLNEAKGNLTTVIAEKMGIERKVSELKSQLKEHEGYTAQALDKGDEGLALEIAGKIAGFSNDLEAQEKLLEGYIANISQLKQTIAGTDRNIKAMEREISMVKTTEAVQKANVTATAKFSGTDSAMGRATESLERIKAKQQKRSDQTKATMEFQKESNGGDLQAKLKAAGIVSGDESAKSVLERIKAGKSTGN